MRAFVAGNETRRAGCDQSRRSSIAERRPGFPLLVLREARDEIGDRYDSNFAALTRLDKRPCGIEPREIGRATRVDVEYGCVPRSDTVLDRRSNSWPEVISEYAGDEDHIDILWGRTCPLEEPL